MFEHAATIVRELDAGRPVALAVAVGVHGGGPRPLGSSMLVLADGSVHGSLSSGCVEAAVVARAELVLAGDPPTREIFTGDPDADGRGLLDVGLTCGGALEVLTVRLDATTPPAAADCWRRATAGLATCLGLRLDGGFTTAPASVLLAVETTGGAARHRDADGGDVLVVGHRTAPRFLVYGAVDLAEPLAGLAALTGYEVTVCDPRRTFTTRERFPSAHHVVVDRPDRHLSRTLTDARSVVCVLLHDERFDTPVLVDALRRDLVYVGAMGSRTTCARRSQRLLGAGVTQVELDRLHQPLGLDLGASTPPDTAVSVMAEVVAVRNGRHGEPLQALTGPIHSGISR